MKNPDLNAPRFCGFLLLLCVTAMAGCERKTAPSAAPAPQTVAGLTRDRTSYRFLKWKEGLTILLVDDCDASNMSGSNNSGEPYRCKGNAYLRPTGSDEWKVGYEWQLETTDGRRAVFAINNVEYDLSNGAVFRIDVNGDEATVQQFDQNLFAIQPDTTSCDHFVNASPQLKKAADTPTTEHRTFAE